jgi:hypothetical protein
MNVEERAKGLLKLVEAYRTQECRELIERAKAEVQDIMSRAWRREREHLHTSVEAERSRARSLIQAAQAERATRERSSGDRANAHLLSLAWPLLERGLTARWADHNQRDAWVAQALDGAFDALPAGQWTIHYAPTWSAPERAAPCIALAARLAERGAPAPSFSPAPEMVAGLIVDSGSARYDASLEGLLQDRPRLQARLLALFAARVGGHAGNAGAVSGKPSRDGGHAGNAGAVSGEPSRDGGGRAASGTVGDDAKAENQT